MSLDHRSLRDLLEMYAWMEMTSVKDFSLFFFLDYNEIERVLIYVYLSNLLSCFPMKKLCNFQHGETNDGVWFLWSNQFLTCVSD